MKTQSPYRITGSSDKLDTYFLGDIHGNFSVIESLCKYNKLRNSNIIQVGDFGIGFKSVFSDRHDLGVLNRVLQDSNVYLYVVRGNHDNPNWFTADHPINTTEKFSNITFVCDYSILHLGKHNILCVGGAVSIDRIYRNVNNLGHWEDERFSTPKPWLIPSAEDCDISVVVTHNAPAYCTPTNFNNLVYQYAANDVDLLTDLTEERSRITRLFELLLEKGHQIQHHFYGHFHFSNTEFINDTCHKLLDVNELYLLH